MAKSAASVIESENGVELCAALDAFAVNLGSYNSGAHSASELWQSCDKLRQAMALAGMDVPEELAQPE